MARLIKSGVLDGGVLDLGEARAAGVACGLSSTADVIDTSVATLARCHGAIVVTSAPADLRRLDSGLTLVIC